MYKHLTDNLFGNIKRPRPRNIRQVNIAVLDQDEDNTPYLPWPLGGLSVPFVDQRQYDKYAHKALDNLRTKQFRSRRGRQDSHLIATNQSCRSEELAATLVDREIVEYVIFSEERHDDLELNERRG